MCIFFNISRGILGLLKTKASVRDENCRPITEGHLVWLSLTTHEVQGRVEACQSNGAYQEKIPQNIHQPQNNLSIIAKTHWNQAIS